MSDRSSEPSSRWWQDRAQETFWLEATDRTDIGADLRAPELDGGGNPNWRYDLFKATKVGDTVLHYDKKPTSQGIVGYSRVAGPWEPLPVTWAARGSYARDRGDLPVERPGFVVPLSGFTAVPVISLSAIRQRAADLAEMIAALKHDLPRGTSIYFPFELSGSREPRLLQGYAWKVPVAFLAMFPDLSVLVPEASNRNATTRSSDPVASRNPPWSRDELILALDLYHRTAGSSITHQSPEIRQLSELLNALNVALSPTKATLPTYRNANGVYMKLMNFRRFDPAFISQGSVGLRRGNNLEPVIWNEYRDDPTRLQAAAEAIRAAVLGGQLNDVPNILDEEEALEGGVLTRLHHYRERDAGLARRRKKQALSQHGRLACDACRFDFRRAYGSRGDGFIECHHTKPLHTLSTSTPTRMSDLALLCANCHRMIHAKQPWLTVDELRACLHEAQ